MRLSRKAVFRHGCLEQVSRDLYEMSPVVRFKIDGEFFFTNMLQFELSDELYAQMDRLESGQDVFAGGHRLDDGSFWLHWLKVPGVLDLVPKPREEAAGAAWEKLLGLGVGGLILVVFGIALVFGGGTGGAALMGSLLMVGGVVCGAIAVDNVGVLLNSRSAVERTMHEGLHLLDSALTEGRSWNPPDLGPSTASSPIIPPTELAPGLHVCHVEKAQAQSRTIRRSTGRGSVSVEFIIYDFLCEGDQVSWLVRNEAYSSISMRAFRWRHPPFLAKGDEILVYCADGSSGLTGILNRFGLPNLDGKPVLELFNCTDQTAYWSETNHRGSIPFLYVGAGLVLAFMLVVITIMGLFGNDEPWFFPAIVSIVEFDVFAMCSGVLAMGVVILIMEAILAMSDSDPEIADGRNRWREAVAPLRRTSDTSGFDPRRREWLVKNRIWLLLGLMVVAGFGLSLWF